MYWKDEGYLLSKNNFDENSIIIDAFTLEHGRCTGVIYGGSSRKQKKKIQIGNKILFNWKSKGDNRVGYFDTELLKPIIPSFFDDKKKSICVISASNLLKILLPERQTNKKIYHLFEYFINSLSRKDWIKFYILWELSLIKELGYASDSLDDKKFISLDEKEKLTSADISKALSFNKRLFIENFILPNKLKLPLSRNILEKYYLS